MSQPIKSTMINECVTYEYMNDNKLLLLSNNNSYFKRNQNSPCIHFHFLTNSNKVKRKHNILCTNQTTQHNQRIKRENQMQVL